MQIQAQVRVLVLRKLSTHPIISGSRPNPSSPRPDLARPSYIDYMVVFFPKVLMATVADRFPTPCTASFWTPDSEGQQHQLEAVSSNLSEASSTTRTTTPAFVGATGGDGRGFGLGGEVDSAGSSSAYPKAPAARGTLLDPVPGISVTAACDVSCLLSLGIS